MTLAILTLTRNLTLTLTLTRTLVGAWEHSGIPDLSTLTPPVNGPDP